MRSSTSWEVEPREETCPIPPPPDRALVLGLPVDRLRMFEVVEHILGWIDLAHRMPGAVSRLSEGGTLCAYHVITLNPEIAMASRKDAVLHRIINAADMVVPDGVGIVWAARLLGEVCPERVPGIELVERLAVRAAERGDRIFLLGAAPGVAEAAGAHLMERSPGLTIAGAHAGSPDAEDDAETLRRVRDANPDLLIIAYGAPAQEYWIARLRTQVGVPVVIGVGGALDVISGQMRRAPLWMRRMGCEWLYRLWREPRRWRRMLALPRFAWAVLRRSGEATHDGENADTAGNTDVENSMVDLGIAATSRTAKEVARRHDTRLGGLKGEGFS